MRRPFAPPLAALALAGVLLGAGCRDDGSAPALPTGAFTGDLACKIHAATADPSQDCVAWTYDPVTRVLDLRHENACLNCCPEHDPRVARDGTALVLVEDEAGGMCDCFCLYDLDYTVTDVPPVPLTLVVHPDCLLAGEEPLQGVLDLAGATAGVICVERTHYPWP